jgi:large repetitive protein
VVGWAWSLSAITSIDVFVDGNLAGSATFGLPRDISDAFPGAPTDLGYQYSLDSTTLSNGSHTITVKPPTRTEESLLSLQHRSQSDSCAQEHL